MRSINLLIALVCFIAWFSAKANCNDFFNFDPEDSFTQFQANRINQIEQKVQNQKSLSKDDLRLIYEMEFKKSAIIRYSDDENTLRNLERLKSILESRTNRRADIAYALGLKEEQVSTNVSEFLAGDGQIIYHQGDLSLKITSEDEIHRYLKKITVNGSVSFGSLQYVQKLDLSNVKIKGSLKMTALTRVNEFIKFPKELGELDLLSLTFAKNAVYPKFIKKNVYLNSLISAEGLNLTHTFIGWNVFLSGLTSTQGLDLSSTFIGKSLTLTGLDSGEGVNLSGFYSKNIGFAFAMKPEEVEKIILPRDKKLEEKETRLGKMFFIVDKYLFSSGAMGEF